MSITVIETIGNATEVGGVLLLVSGLLLALARCLRAAPDARARYLRLRHDMGRAILLGLEVLVAADIVRTVAYAPTMNGVAVLAVVIAIRTFLSWSLALELDGRWPWQRAAFPPSTPPQENPA
jgi:uncharacterized membrane protein